jgi:hypothetical protein
MRRSLPWLLPFLVAALGLIARSVDRAQSPATGGPSTMLLTRGALLTALGATIAAISRRRSR